MATYRSSSPNWGTVTPLFHHKTKAPDKGFLGIKFKVPDSLLSLFFTAVTTPISPLPTNSPISGFLRPPQTRIYTILCCLRRPATLKPRTLSPRRPGLSPRPQQKLPIAVLGNMLLVPGGMRKLQTSLRPSWYIPDKLIKKIGLIALWLGND